MRHYAARRDSSKWIELPVISVDRLGESQTTAHGRVIRKGRLSAAPR